MFQSRIYLYRVKLTNNLNTQLKNKILSWNKIKLMQIFKSMRKLIKYQKFNIKKLQTIIDKRINIYNFKIKKISNVA